MTELLVLCLMWTPTLMCLAMWTNPVGPKYLTTGHLLLTLGLLPPILLTCLLLVRWL